MQIAVYAEDIGKDIIAKNIIKLTLDYCQNWDCYPAIEHYCKKEDLLSAIENRNIEIIILAAENKNEDELVKKIASIGVDINIIRLLKDNIEGKITEGLLACGIPTGNSSLCRVHLKSQPK